MHKLVTTDNTFIDVRFNYEKYFTASAIKMIEAAGSVDSYVSTYQTDGRNSAGGTETCYALDGPGIESRRERNFFVPSTAVQRPSQPPVQWAPGSFPGVKRPERGADHPPPSSAEVAKGLEVYPSPLLCACAGISWDDFYLFANIHGLGNFHIRDTRNQNIFRNS